MNLQLVILVVACSALSMGALEGHKLRSKVSTEVEIEKMDDVQTKPQLASIGIDKSENIRADRFSFVSRQKSHEVYGGLEEKVENSTVFVDCSQFKAGMTGVVLKLEGDSFNGIKNFEAIKENCSSKIIMTVGHVTVSSTRSGFCKISHKSNRKNIVTVLAPNIHTGEFYDHDSNSVEVAGEDYGFIKMNEALNVGSTGLPLCKADNIVLNSCSNGSGSLTVSQRYKLNSNMLFSSERCCYDELKSPLQSRIAHLCHIEDGASGGPLVSLASGEPCIAGVNVGRSNVTRHNYATSVYNENFKNQLSTFLEDHCSD